MLEQQLQRLAERRINLLPTLEIATHYLFERDGFVALVERKEHAFGNIGAPGLLVEQGGFAALVWRGTEAWFVGKGFEQRASTEQVTLLRSFAYDLEYALKRQQ